VKSISAPFFSVLTLASSGSYACDGDVVQRNKKRNRHKKGMSLSFIFLLCSQEQERGIGAKEKNKVCMYVG